VVPFAGGVDMVADELDEFDNINPKLSG